MSTITEYVETNLASFDEKPFNAVDSLVLSQFCGVRLEAIGAEPEPLSRPKHVSQGILSRFSANTKQRRALTFERALRAELFPEMFGGFVTAEPGELRRLICALAASPRFRDLSIVNYRTVLDEADATQFAAISFVYKEEFAYIGFRGTDAAITGWREDFDMGYKFPVPSQVLALDYVSTTADELPCKLIIGGHSKGGNLATFAAIRSDPSIRNRIEKVYNHDGPGFKPGTMSNHDAVKMNILVDKTVPQDSIVGMLLEDPSRTRIVRSRAKGIKQHSAFTWEVNEAGTDFQLADGLSAKSLAFRDAFTTWLDSYDDTYLRTFVCSLFELVETNGIEDVRKLLGEGINPILRIFEMALRAPAEPRSVLFDGTSRYAKLLMERITEPSNGKESNNGQDN